MSQALNHLKWCVNKAKKELDQGKKHRGLVQSTPDKQRAEGHLNKALHNFSAIDYFSDGGYGDWSASAAFYTIYHCFLAILAKHGYESRNQECTISVIQYLKETKKLDLSDELINSLKHEEDIEEKQETVIEVRENLQYGVQTDIDEEKIKRLKIICAELISITEEEVTKRNES